MPLRTMAKMTVTGTPGTGTITLNVASAGFQTLAAAGTQDGEEVSYNILDGANWEVGRGVYSSSGPTLSRGPIYSSNSNAAISATSAAVVASTMLDGDVEQLVGLFNSPLASQFTTFSTDGTNPVLGNRQGRGLTIDSGVTVNSVQSRGAQQAIPGSTYTLTARLRGAKAPLSFRGWGVFISDGTKVNAIERISHSSSPDFLQVSANNSNQFNVGGQFGDCFRIMNDGTHRNYYNGDGYDWNLIYQESSGTYFTETVCGIIASVFESDSALTGDHIYITCPFWLATTP